MAKINMGSAEIVRFTFEFNLGKGNGPAAAITASTDTGQAESFEIRNSPGEVLKVAMSLGALFSVLGELIEAGELT